MTYDLRLIMRIDIITLFPGMFTGVLGESILKRAQTKGIVSFSVIDLRDFTSDKHRKVDDRPFGGGAGMVIKAEPVLKALEAVKAKSKRAKVILLSPQGEKLDQTLSEKLAKMEHLVFLCGHYEGFDERIQRFVDGEISIGDYVLTCGELPAMVVIDSVVRLLPGALGDQESARDESFAGNLLEYPHYTRPADFGGMKVPAVLLSGNHKAIKRWRLEQALSRTKRRRPDLLKAKGKSLTRLPWTK